MTAALAAISPVPHERKLAKSGIKFPSTKKEPKPPTTPNPFYDDTQFFSVPPPTKAAPIHQSFLAEDIYDASPKKPQLTLKNTSRANIEAKVKRYFPDFLTLQEAESPSGPLKEPSDRNEVIFPPDLQMKYADEDTLRKLYRMQVLMIQSMLPYSAWPRRVAMEMEDYFLDTRGDVSEQSLYWAGTVHGILQPNENLETDKCPADRLEDSDVDNESEDLISQVLAQAEEDTEQGCRDAW
ncbi:hypothetical protein K3495_g10468 [Podosphaera aphanis]|nr:hypothetical protein K3495_g10468 [Podosphaera aphanis]